MVHGPFIQGKRWSCKLPEAVWLDLSYHSQRPRHLIESRWVAFYGSGVGIRFSCSVIGPGDPDL